METKICSTCKVEKKLDEFGKCKKYKDNLRYNCKECRNKQEKNNRNKLKLRKLGLDEEWNIKQERVVN